MKRILVLIIILSLLISLPFISLANQIISLDGVFFHTSSQNAVECDTNYNCGQKQYIWLFENVIGNGRFLSIECVFRNSGIIVTNRTTEGNTSLIYVCTSTDDVLMKALAVISEPGLTFRLKGVCVRSSSDIATISNYSETGSYQYM